MTRKRINQIVTIAAHKGGTGKTTTAAALIGAAAEDGEKVLAIDLDPQANLSFILKADLRRSGAYEVMTGKAEALDAIQTTGSGYDVISASRNLSVLSTGGSSARRLHDALEPIRGEYDRIIIDTPSNGELMYNGLMAADLVIVPLEVASSSLQGGYQMIETLSVFKKSKPELKAAAILTKFNSRPNIDKLLLKNMIEILPGKGLPICGVIPQGKDARESEAYQETIIDYAPKSKQAAAYLIAWAEIKEGKV